jgi:PKD repeat protein
VVGLLEFDGYYANDIRSYESQAGLPNVTLANVLLNRFNGKPGANNAEVALDIEMVISMAPGVSKVMVYEGTSGNSMLSRMASDNQAKQISASWSYPINSTTENLFRQLGAQGISFFNASGDSDAYSGTSPTPTDDPYITIVGGTTLAMNGAGGSYAAETVWNWNNGQGTGGGISTRYSIPTWQQGLDMTANQGSTSRRNFPDVALTADNVYVTYDNGSAGAFGGTSCAAPLWAGFMALVNQQAAANGRPTAGFINPAVYALGKGADYANGFHDITVGNNTSTTSPSAFFAVPGYDLCTGWGTPTGSNLINALTLPPVVNFTANPTSGIAPLTVCFTNLSRGANGFNWVLGDGHTSTSVNPVNTYSNPGIFSVTLTAAGLVGTNTLTRTGYIVANYPPPVASFAARPTQGVAPLTVTFTNLSSGATNYSWTFGDGQTSVLANPANTYTNPGSYSVTLLGVGPGGANLLTLTNYIVVAYPPPVVDFAADPTNGTAPLAVSFSNLSLGATNYLWSFGDGNASTLAQPVNVYSNAGVYSVTLSAAGLGGSNGLTLSNYVVVTNPPPAPDLQLVSLLVSPGGAFQFVVTNTDGTPITPEQQSQIGIYTSTNPGLAFADWLRLTNSTWLTNGLLQVNDEDSLVYPKRFYRAVQSP